MKSMPRGNHRGSPCRLLGLALLIIVTGCGDEGSGPVRPGTATGSPAASKLPHLMLVLPTTNGEDLSIFREVLQSPENGAGKEYIYREGIVRQGMGASQQAELIQEAMEKGVSAFLVVAADPDAVAPALIEAQERGLAVVVIGREIPVEGDPLPLVTFPPAETSAARVAAALSRDPDGKSASEMRAVILSDTAAEWHTPELAEALKSIAAEAGATATKVVPFEKRAASAREALSKAIEEDPSIGLILFEDRAGAEAAALVADGKAPGPDGGRRIGGFVPDLDQRLGGLLRGRATVINRKVPDAAKQAARMALQALKDKKPPGRVVIEPEVPGDRPTSAESKGP